MGRPRAPHGTSGAYRRHKDKHERVCDLCQAWKDGERLDVIAKTEKKHPGTTAKIKREVDYVQETLVNLKYVEDAMKLVPAEKMGPLSKRKSELLAELRQYQGEAGGEVKEIDPLEAALTAGPDLANVTRIA